MEGGEEENSDELRKEQSQTSGVKIVDFRRDWESSVAMFIVSYQKHYKMHTRDAGFSNTSPSESRVVLAH
jgi:hypothetical protein